MPEPLVFVIAAFALLSVVLLVTALAAVQRQRWMGTSLALVLAVLCLALAALAATVSVAMQGYRALTREVVAATVVTRPSGPERFVATFTFPDGRRELYELTGNALYVDAHIVKWHPLANILGLHTAYQLDRVSGRYDRLEDEQTKPRRMFALSRPTPAAAPRIPIDRGPCHARRGEDLAEQADTRVRRAPRIAEDARHARLDRLHLTVAEGERGRDRVELLAHLLVDDSVEGDVEKEELLLQLRLHLAAH